MIQAFLFDLDDTLLKNNIDRFLPAYVQELSRSLADRFAPEKVAEALQAGTRAMLANRDPEVTLRAAFDVVFYPMLPAKKEDLMPVLDHFYRDRFPALQQYTQPSPGAAEVVEAAFRRNARVAIATNPLFPLTAIQQRIQWAGLDPVHFPFDLVTSYESMHFAKPQPEYVAEILALLACSPENALFIGNDIAEDIAPARALGTATFHMQPNSSAPESPTAGTLSELANRIYGGAENFLFTAAPSSHLHIILTGNLAAIAHLARTSGWRHPSAEEGWGAVEIACHLRDYESEILQPRLRLILSAENPYLSPVPSDTWPEERLYFQQDGETAVRGFVAARRETIALLSGLDEKDWARPARHAVFGPTTLTEQVRFIARHDLMHVEQLRAAYAVCGRNFQ